MFLNTDIRKIDTLENTESAIKMNKPEKTGNIGYTRLRKIKQKNTTHYVLDTTLRKRKQIR